MWVIAKNWIEAMDKWKQLIATENSIKPEDVEECQGISLVCESGDLIQ